MEEAGEGSCGAGGQVVTGSGGCGFVKIVGFDRVFSGLIRMGSLDGHRRIAALTSTLLGVPLLLLLLLPFFFSDIMVLAEQIRGNASLSHFDNNNKFHEPLRSNQPIPRILSNRIVLLRKRNLKYDTREHIASPR